MLKFSVIIPVYNEERTAIPVYFSVNEVMEKIGGTYEIIFVNDGSTDNSLSVLKSINLKPANLVIIDLNKHSGQSAAMQGGFDFARGETIITLDGDFQNDPKDIPKLLDAMIKSKYDAVCGWRWQRKDRFSKVFISRAASIFIRFVIHENIHDFGCTMRVFKREVLRNICLSRGMHRLFVPILAKLKYSIGEVKVRHHPRRFGRSKYNIHNRLIFIIDFIRFLILGVNGMNKHRINYQIKEIIRR